MLGHGMTGGRQTSEGQKTQNTFMRSTPYQGNRSHASAVTTGLRESAPWYNAIHKAKIASCWSAGNVATKGQYPSSLQTAELLLQEPDERMLPS
eukprot:60862-Hanusia_phi.AAC.1